MKKSTQPKMPSGKMLMKSGQPRREKPMPGAGIGAGGTTKKGANKSY